MGLGGVVALLVYTALQSINHRPFSQKLIFGAFAPRRYRRRSGSFLVVGFRPEVTQWLLYADAIEASGLIWSTPSAAIRDRRKDGDDSRIAQSHRSVSQI